MRDFLAVMTRKRRVRFNYPADFKNDVLSSLNNSSLRNAAKTCGVPLSTLYRWRKNPGRPALKHHPLLKGPVPPGRHITRGSIEAGIAQTMPIASDSRRHYRFDRSRARHSRKVLDRLMRARAIIENNYFEHVSCDARHAVLGRLAVAYR